jgi:hypothetical protein
VSSNENPLAGQGSVLLDIGGDIGALVVRMPPDMEGLEVEIRPTRRHPTETHDHAHVAHVAVVARPTDAGLVHSLVFPELRQGAYELYLRPAGPVELTVTITGGKVTEASWPRET